MGDETEKEIGVKKSAGGFGILIWLGIFLAVYVLSIGPVIRMYDQGMIPRRWNGFLSAFYAPLEWADGHTLLHKPLEMYIDLWSKRDE